MNIRKDKIVSGWRHGSGGRAPAYKWEALSSNLFSQRKEKDKKTHFAFKNVKFHNRRQC
jgi:hypothetical protein